jgi:hypothetical protein
MHASIWTLVVAFAVQAAVKTFAGSEGAVW